MSSDAEAPPRALSAGVRARLRAHLEALYPTEEAAQACAGLTDLLEGFMAEHSEAGRAGPLFDQRDVLVITYPDQVREEGRAPLRSLREFLAARFGDAVTGVHVLPFYPATSDDGFAVADYRAVDPAFGEWEDVRGLAGEFRLMVDAVVNHVSASSAWFQAWCSGDPAFEGWFVEVDPDTDTSSVTRPRATPLLTPFETAQGTRWVWTTFSADQVDLDYANPAVLLAVTEALLDYLAAGAAMIRLDAVAFLWKGLGTSCVHLEQTHEIVRLWRTVVDTVAPGTVLITETNVPHAENVSYFGDGSDEAHLVYQFPLAPLVLSAFHLADASTLQEWVASLATPSRQTAFFNFLGSHDGVGLRPCEGLLTRSEIEQLVELCIAHGGGVSYRARPDGSLAPYELNTVFFDALTETGSSEALEVQVLRFLAAQSILLTLAGVPAVYFPALVGSRNWHEGVERTGRLRTINREKFDRAELEAALDDPSSLRHEVATRLSERIRVRASEPAFHPAGAQRALAAPATVLAHERRAVDGSSVVVCLHSVTGLPQRARVAGVGTRGELIDLLSGQRVTAADGVLEADLPPYGVLWLRADGDGVMA